MDTDVVLMKASLCNCNLLYSHDLNANMKQKS